MYVNVCRKLLTGYRIAAFVCSLLTQSSKCNPHYRALATLAKLEANRAAMARDVAPILAPLCSELAGQPGKEQEWRRMWEYVGIFSRLALLRALHFA